MGHSYSLQTTAYSINSALQGSTQSASIQYNRKKKHKNVGSRLSIYLHGHGRSQDSVKNPDGLNKTKIDAYNTDPHAIQGFVQKEGGIVLLSALGTMSCKAQQ